MSRKERSGKIKKYCFVRYKDNFFFFFFGLIESYFYRKECAMHGNICYVCPCMQERAENRYLGKLKV